MAQKDKTVNELQRERAKAERDGDTARVAEIDRQLAEQGEQGGLQTGQANPR